MNKITYQTKFEKGDPFILNGRFHVVLDLKDNDGEPQYKISKNGRKRWVDAAVVDRNALDYTFDNKDGKVV